MSETPLQAALPRAPRPAAPTVDEMRAKAITWARRVVADPTVGRRYNVGTFATEEEAAFEYDRLARAVYGDFARLNFQDSTESSTERKVA